MSCSIIGTIVERHRLMAWRLALRMTPSMVDGAMGIPGTLTGKMASLIAVKTVTIGRATLLPPPSTLWGRWIL